MLCNIDYLVIIEIEAWNGIVGLGFCRFFLYTKDFARGIKLYNTILGGVLYVVAKYRVAPSLRLAAFCKVPVNPWP